MFSMLAVAAAAADEKPSNELKIRLFTAVASVVATVIGMFLVRSGSIHTFVAALLIVGIAPVLGYGLATNSIGNSIVAMILGALGSAVGMIVLSPILWPLLVGATLRPVSLGKLLMWSVISGVIALLAVLFIVIPTGGQNPGWLQTAFLTGGILWGLGVSYQLSKDG